MIRSIIYKFSCLISLIVLAILVVIELIENIYGLEIVWKAFIRGGLFIIFFIIVIDPKGWEKNKVFFLLYPFIVLSYIFGTYCLLEDNILDGIYYSLRILFWIFGTLFFYKMILMGYVKERYLNTLLIIIIVFYFIMVVYFMFNPALRFTQNLSIYALLWCIPLLLIMKRTAYNKLFFVMAIITIFISLKRGAILALILSIMIYLFTYFIINKSFKVSAKILALFFVLGFVLFLTLSVVHEVRPDFFERRIADLTGADKAIGSGRGEFFPIIFDRYISSFHSSPEKFFFGFGSRSVQDLIGEYYGGIGVYAHSDWLQMLYDYGMLGFTILTWIHISILRMIYLGIKQKFEYVPSLAMTYVVFFLLNIYSGILFFPNSLYFGIFLSLYNFLWIKNTQHVNGTETPIAEN